MKCSRCQPENRAGTKFCEGYAPRDEGLAGGGPAGEGGTHHPPRQRTGSAGR
jgi:hypothetical protein